jgi:hypothetical protein
MESSKWEKFRGRIAPTTVQQLLEYTEEINQQIEKVLVGLYNDVTDQRAKVEAVGVQIERVQDFPQALQKLEVTSDLLASKISDMGSSISSISIRVTVMQRRIQNMYFLVAVNSAVAVLSFILVFSR